MRPFTIAPHLYRQLFLDDDAVETISGLERVLHRPTGCGPVLRPDRSRGEKHVQSGSAPQWNPEKSLWEWWYKGYTTFTEDSLALYATSTDGLNWEKPELGRYEWKGSTANNIAYKSPEYYLNHLVRDEDDEDPQRRYKAFFSEADHMNRCPGVSPDGFSWTLLDIPPIPSQDTSQFICDDIGQRYLATVKHRTEWGRSAWLVTSPDFVHWTDPQLILHTDEIDQENRKQRIQEVVDDPAYLSPPAVDGREYIAQLYMLPLMTYEGLYIGFPLLFNPSGADPEQTNYTGINQVELAVSRNALEWRRVADRAVFVGVEPWEGGANFGNAQVALCGPPIVRHQEIWIYYLAYRFRGHRNLFAALDPSIYNDTFFEESSAICLAKLRLDGFVSLDASTKGELLTAPFLWKGEELYLNADAGGGEVLVELMDADSRTPLPGRSAGACRPLRGDHLRTAVIWDRDPTTEFGERPVRLRILLRRAKLYSFWLE